MFTIYGCRHYDGDIIIYSANDLLILLLAGFQ